MRERLGLGNRPSWIAIILKRIGRASLRTRSLFPEDFCLVSRQVRQLSDLCPACECSIVFGQMGRFLRQEVWSIVIPQLMPTSRGKD